MGTATKAGGEEAAARDAGPLPELAWLPVGKLSVDHSYQRTLESSRSQSLIGRLVAEFRWSAFQAILATSRTGGGWLVLDGQHRAEAARRLDIPHVPAVVLPPLSVADQAAAFVRANLDRVTVNPFALHHARIVAGDEWAQTIDRVCSAVGLSIPRYPVQSDQLKPGQTLALGAISRILRDLGERDGRIAIDCVAEPFENKRGAVRALMLRAVHNLLKPIESRDRRAMALAISRWLATKEPDVLYSKTIQRRATYGGADYINLAALIKSGVAAMPKAPSDGGSSIKPLTKAQLMGGRG